jgi:hypothetical protein
LSRLDIITNYICTAITIDLKQVYKTSVETADYLHGRKVNGVWKLISNDQPALRKAVVTDMRTQVSRKLSQVWRHHNGVDAYTGLNKADYESEASVTHVNLNTFTKESIHLTRHPCLVVEVDHVLEIHLAHALLDKVMSDTHHRRVLRNDRQLQAARNQVVSSLRTHLNGVQTNLNNTTRQINMAKYEACKQVSVDIKNCILNGSAWSSLDATAASTLSDKLKRQNFRGRAVQRIVTKMTTSCNNIVDSIGESENGIVNDFSALLAGDFMDKLVL